MTGTNFSDWFNQSEGTFLVEATPSVLNAGDQQAVFQVDAGADDPAMVFWRNTTPEFRVLDTGEQAGANLDDWVAGTTFKAAMAYKANDFASSQDGGAVSSDTSGTVPSVDRLRFGKRSTAEAIFNGHIKRIEYWGQRRPDVTLQNETAR